MTYMRAHDNNYLSASYRSKSLHGHLTLQWFFSVAFNRFLINIFFYSRDPLNVYDIKRSMYRKKCVHVCMNFNIRLKKNLCVFFKLVIIFDMKYEF